MCKEIWFNCESLLWGNQSVMEQQASGVCVEMWGAWQRWVLREVRRHFNSSAGSLAVFLGCVLLLLLRAAPPWLLCACCAAAPSPAAFIFSQLAAAAETSLSPYWGSISSLIQPCWESLLQDAGVSRPHSHFPFAEKETRSRANTLFGSFRCDANVDVTESGVLQGELFYISWPFMQQ